MLIRLNLLCVEEEIKALRASCNYALSVLSLPLHLRLLSATRTIGTFYVLKHFKFFILLKQYKTWQKSIVVFPFIINLSSLDHQARQRCWTITSNNTPRTSRGASVSLPNVARSCYGPLHSLDKQISRQLARKRGVNHMRPCASVSSARANVCCNCSSSMDSFFRIVRKWDWKTILGKKLKFS